MNKTLKKLLKRNIVDNFKQFLSVIFIVLLSTMLLTGFITNSYTLKSCVNDYFKNTNLADIWITTDNVSAEDEEFFIENGIEFNKRLYFESVAEIKSLNISNSVRVYVYKSKIEEPYNRICEPYIETGKVSVGHGCLIDKNVAQDNNVRAGFDNINFSYTVNVDGNDFVLDFEEQLTGTMSLDECADTFSTWAVVVEEEMFLKHLKEKLSEKIEGFDAENFNVPYNQILVKTENVEQTKLLISEHYSSENTTSKMLSLFGREQIESVELLAQEVEQSKKIIYVFPVIFIIVSILVILTTIDQLILQQKRRIGILKACGIPNKKILKHYSKYGAILCTIGAILGSLLGFLFIPEIMFSRYGVTYSIPKDYVSLKIPYLWLILMNVVVIFSGYVVSTLSCYKILHKKPIECLRYDISWSARKLKKKKRQFKKVPISLKMAIRNIKLKPLRTVMATVGVAGCVALLLSGFGMGNTLSKSINNDFGKVFKYDVISTYKSEEFKERLKSDSRIEVVEEYSKIYAETKVNDKFENVYIYQIAPSSTLSNIKIKGDEVVVSKLISDKFGLMVGNKLSLSVYDKTVTLTISGIVNTSILNGVYVAKDLGFAESFKENGVWIKCSDAKNVVNFANQINGTNTAQTIESQKIDTTSRIASVSTMSKTIRVFGVLLAIVVLLNLIFLILNERKVEIATLKVVGLNSWQVSISVILEIVFISIIGTAIGLALGYPLLLLILAVSKISVVYYFVSIKFVSYLLTVLIIVLTILAVLFVCYLKIRKVDMAESLKRVE